MTPPLSQRQVPPCEPTPEELAEVAALQSEREELILDLTGRGCAAGPPSLGYQAGARARLAEIGDRLVVLRLARRLDERGVQPPPPPGVERFGLGLDGKTIVLERTGRDGRLVRQEVLAKDRSITITSNPGRVLGALALPGEHELSDRTLEYALRSLRDAFGRDAIVGNGSNARLAAPFGVSLAFREEWERLYARRSRHAR
jgi:hypothetical protein